MRPACLGAFELQLLVPAAHRLLRNRCYPFGIEMLNCGERFCNEMTRILIEFGSPSMRMVYLIKKTVVDLLGDRYLLRHRGTDD